jgi:hypothetical protein
LAEELARVATAPKGSRNQQLWESGRNLFNFVAAGALPKREVHHGLLRAADRNGLLAEEPRQTQRTLRSARQAGLAQPRRLPERTIPRRAPTTRPPASRTGGERTDTRERR